MIDQNTILAALAIFLIPIVGFFIRTMITDLKSTVHELSIKVATNSTSIEVLKSDHNNLGTKLDDMQRDLKEISLYIRNLKQV